MMSRASKVQTSGVVGDVLEGITGEVKEYNEAIDKSVKIKTRQKKVTEDIAKQEIIITKLEKARTARKLSAEQFNKALDRQKGLIKDLNREWNENDKALGEVNHNLDEMGKKKSVAQTLGTGFKFLAGKVAGAATAYFSFRSALEGAAKRVQMSAVQVQKLGTVTNDYWGTLDRIRQGYGAWNDAINGAVKGNAKFGISVDETNGMINSLSQDLRLSTKDYENMAQIVGDTAKDIGFLSKALQVDTNDLVTATTEASRKFNKSTKQMGDELAGVYYAVQDLRDANKDLRLNMGDMTKMVLEAQASYQGYNFNLRQTALIMGNVAAAAQKQGATYEMSMKGAQGLVDVISGGKAPDWAKFMVGDEMLGEIKRLTKGVKDQDIPGILAKEFAIDEKSEAGKAQLEGLKNMATRYKEFGGFSAANMTEELLSGTNVGMEKMFELVKKYAKRPEGREILKRVFNFDDAAATGAILAIQSGKTLKEFTGKIEGLKTESAGRRAPTLKDLQDQTKDYHEAIGMATAGIDGIKNLLDSYFHDPKIAGILGTLGTATTGILQMVQTGSMMGIAGKMGATPGIVTATKALAGFRLETIKSGSNLSKFGKTAGVVGAAIAAFEIGWEIGTKLREMFPVIDKTAQSLLDFGENLVRKTAGLDSREMEEASYGLTVVAKENSTTLDILTKQWKVASGEVKEGSLEWKQAAFAVAGATDADLEARAKAIADQKHLNKAVVLAKLEELRASKVTAQQLLAALGQPVPEPAPGLPAEALPPTAATAATPTAAAVTVPAVRTMPPTPEQKRAAAIQVSEKLAPEVRSMATTLFEGMAKQSTEYYTQLTSVAQTFWSSTMQDQSQAAWDRVVDDFRRSMGLGTMVPLMPTSGGAGAGGRPGAPAMGMGASVGPDGSINIRLQIPRAAMDKSNSQTSQLHD
jgi:hypothetical protein